ncbi:protein transport protein sec31 like protein a [Quercus suber]|uniref:Protein transport protein sec31 like protein a n=1 Tax=Quercus suber TaxID=58331 RepID=A0AAW0LT48_QUESU
MAAGTMAGAVDLSFSSSASLELFKLDFQSDDHEMPLVGETPSSERFNRITWGKPIASADKFSLGLVAGGLVDGTIDIWNPLALIRSEASENALVGHLSRHKGPVRGLEFNAISPNLLASGADDGEICIWDLANPAEPSHFPPLRSLERMMINNKTSGNLPSIASSSSSSSSSTIVAPLSKLCFLRIEEMEEALPEECLPNLISLRTLSLEKCPLPQGMRYLTALQELNVEDSGVVDISNDWDEMEWQGLRTLLSLKFYKLPKLVSLPMGLQYVISLQNLRIWYCLEVERKDLKAAGAETLPNGCRGLRIHGWEIETRKLSILNSSNLQLILFAMIVSKLPTGTNWNFDVYWYPKIAGVISASSFDGKIGIYNIESIWRWRDEFGAAPLRAPKWYKRPAGASFGFGGKLVGFRPRPSAAGVPVGASEVYVHTLVTEDSLFSRSSEFEAAIQNGERSEDDRETWNFLKVMFEDDGTARTKLLSYLDTAPDSEQLQQEPDGFDNGAFDDAVQSALIVGDDKGAVAQCISANEMTDALVIANVVSAMVNNDLLSLVNTRPLKIWKETLALLCSDLMEKSIVLALAIGQKRFSASLCKLVEKYAEILASQGLLTTTMEYLKLLGSNELSPELVILRDRIALATEPGSLV